MKELLCPLQHLGMDSRMKFVPLQLGSLKGLRLLRVGYLCLCEAKCRELVFAALEYPFRHLLIFMVRKVQERSRCRELFAHEQHRDAGCGQQHAHRYLCGIEADDMLQAITRSSIADLIVVLDEVNEMMRRESINRPAVCAPTIGGVVAIKHKHLLQRLREIGETSEVLVV